MLLAWMLAGPLASGAGPAADSTLQAEAARLTQEVVSLNGQYEKAAPPERPGVLEQLLTAAINREQRFLQLMEQDPKVIFQLALPANFRGSLPAEVQPHVEQEVEVEGMLQVLHEDRDHGSRYLYFLNLDSEKLSLHFVSRPPMLLTGSRVRVRGIRLGQAIALE